VNQESDDRTHLFLDKGPLDYVLTMIT
jgi:hypothetical protein